MTTLDETLGRLFIDSLAKALVVSDRNGHVWQFFGDPHVFLACSRCRRIEKVLTTLGDDPEIRYEVVHEGDGYCAELMGGGA